MQKFEITLRNEKARTYQTLSWIIIFVNIVINIYFTIYTTDRSIASGYLIVLIGTGAALLLRIYLQANKKKWQVSIDLIFWLLLIGWVINDQYWLALIMFVFTLLLGFTLRKMIVFFSEENIRYPSVPYRTITWPELNNLIIKDGILTIDFKNNKLIQQLIDQDRSAVNEKEFNDFCCQQLKK